MRRRGAEEEGMDIDVLGPGELDEDEDEDEDEGSGAVQDTGGAAGYVTSLVVRTQVYVVSVWAARRRV
jgi:hypothetical protein